MANEKRVRSGGVAGALSSGVAIAATSMSSAGLADLPVVDTTNHAALTLFTTDANGRVTKREIVYVTAHTASATTATIVKAQEGTSDQAWSTNDKWVHAPTVRDQASGRASAITWTGGPNGTAPNQGVNITSTNWADVGAATDQAVTAQAGDLVEISLNGLSDNAAVSLYVAVVTRVSGANVNSAGGGGVASDTNGLGIAGWGNSVNNWLQLTGSIFYTVQAADVSGGKVTFRLRARVSAAVTKFIFAGTANALIFGVKNLGPQES